MPRRAEHHPGEPAPERGHYESLNIFGSPAGDSVHLEKGEPLPALPRGYTWRRAEEGEQ
jgi:hypothetical protein